MAGNETPIIDFIKINNKVINLNNIIKFEYFDILF